MADISKCSGKKCKLKKSCYRFTAKADKYMQSYFAEPPLKSDKTCEYYWPIKKEAPSK